MQTKLFLGTRLTPELKMELKGDFSPLQCIRHEGKEYIGHYIPNPQPTLAEIRSLSDHFLNTLQESSPDFRVDTLPVLIFPQLFVG